MSFEAVTALRKFADDNKDKDEFIKRACTISRTVKTYEMKKKIEKYENRET
jgi:hypothetical protein